MSEQFWRDNAYADNEPDRVILCVDLKAEQNNHVIWHKTYKMDAWGDTRGTAMARLVSYPVSFAVKAIIDDDFDASLLSTGQQKTVVLMILLSQCNYIVNDKDINPVLLFDEISSHLDSNNRQILLDMINRFNIQFFRYF